MEFKSEKEKLAAQHKLELRKLVIDKVLIGLLILGAGFLANLLLENYKSESIKERFLLEKKLEAIQKISSAYMDMNNAFDSATLQPALTNNERTHLNQVIQTFIEEWTGWAVILSDSYRRQMDYITWLYLGMASYDLPVMKKYRAFQLQLYIKFNQISQQELGLLEQASDDQLRFVEWSIQTANERGSRAYLEANYQQWIQNQSN